MELDININKLKLAIKKAGYFLFENDSKNYNVNIEFDIFSKYLLNLKK